jgi:surface antigen
MHRVLPLFTLIALALALALPAAAQPPSQASAHGWRKKNDSGYAGYAGRAWRTDYGVLSGRCDTAAVLGAAGAAIGGVIGARSSDPVVGVIIGTVIGAVIGATVGREIDRADQACIGHALELAPVGRAVNWHNTRTNVAYTLTPVRDIGEGCRAFRLVGRRGGKEETSTQVACSSGDGRWQVR